jgi:hypothetical protein
MQSHNYSAYFLSLRALATALPSGSEIELVALLETAKTLCISYFYDVSIECPYTFLERSLIEDLLRRKIDKGHRLYFSSSSGFKEMDWWSKDLRRLLKQVCDEVSIGEENRRRVTMRSTEE